MPLEKHKRFNNRLIAGGGKINSYIYYIQVPTSLINSNS